MGQVPPVSTTPESGRRWGGFVCPDCRYVFRVPKEHDGRGLVCPSCRRLLRIPLAGEVTPPLVEERPEPEPTEGAEDGSGQEVRGERRKVRKRRSKSADKSEGPSWEHGSGSGRSSGRRDRRSMRWMLLGGAALFLLLAGGVVLALRHGGDDETIVSGQEKPAETVKPPAKTGTTDTKSDSEVLAEAGPLARTFLEATRVDEVVKLVRNPETAEKRMRSWYPDGKIEAPGLSAFNPTGVVEHWETAVVIDVRTADFSTRAMNFVPTPDGLRIDWESWVGWCEQPWAAFLAERPTAPRLFRVVAKKVDYYNFGFSDDSKWRSVRLEGLDGESFVYGYVERGTLQDQKLQIDPDTNQSVMMVRLRFPEGAAAGSNQVLVAEWVNDGWVEPVAAKP